MARTSWRRLPIRWRLALFYAAMSASVLLLLGLVLYRETDRFLLEAAESRLRSQVEPVLARHLSPPSLFAVTGGPFDVITAAPDAAGSFESVTVGITSGGAGLITGTTALPAGEPGEMEPGRVVSFPPVTASPTFGVRVPFLGNQGLPGPFDEGGPVSGDPASPLLSGDVPLLVWRPPELRILAGLLTEQLSTRETAARVYTPEGDPLPALPSVTVDAPESPVTPRTDAGRVRDAAARRDDTRLVSRDPESGSRTLVLLTPMRRHQDDAAIGVLEVSAPLEAADALLTRLRLLLLLGLGGALGLCVALGVPLTRAALRPLDRLAATTERIVADDLAARSRLPHGGDEIGRLAASFDQMLSRIEAGFQAQRQFVADAAHELRTPLTAIAGLIELLLLGADNEDRAARRRTLLMVDRDLARLTRLVNDLLALSRRDLAIPHEHRPIDLAALTADVQQLTAEVAPDRDVTLVRPPMPVMVVGDADLLRQVLLNLADNARRYTPERGAIRFSVARCGRTAVVEVTDTGPGIAATDLPRIFDRFYRGDRARARGSGGSGLGLAIARAIAEAHGGRLTATSRPGHGATFTLTVPLQAGPRPVSPAPAA
jgi:signal transduction histidine kinase